MGTRSLTVVVHNNQVKVAQYGQWDGYPKGQGKILVSFLQDKTKVAALKHVLPKVRFQTQEDIKEQSEFLKSIGCETSWMNIEQANQFRSKYPMHFRDVGGDILNLILLHNDSDEIILTDSYYFAAESLWCEWAYVVDLDKNTFEVYAGLNKKDLSKEDRFFSLNKKGEKYKPVKLFISFALDKLPDEKEFIKHFK
jgi:hypothetical protein